METPRMHIRVGFAARPGWSDIMDIVLTAARAGVAVQREIDAEKCESLKIDLAEYAFAHNKTCDECAAAIREDRRK